MSNRPEHHSDDPAVDQDAGHASRPSGASDPSHELPEEADPDSGPSTEPDD